MQPRTSKPLRVALAGAGMISWYHMVGWRNLGDRVRVVAVCDPDPARARQRADEFGIPGVYTDRDPMLAAEQIDALDVASPRGVATACTTCSHGCAAGVQDHGERPRRRAP